MSLTMTISFHGGSGKKSLNNLHSYPGDNKILDNKGVTLDELRGFTLGPGGKLYVVVGHKGSDSNVLSFTPPTSAGNQYTNGQPFASDNLSHPFALVFAGLYFFVSNQDSNAITQHDSSNGTFVQDFATGFNQLRGLTYDNNKNNLYAADETGGANGTGSIAWYSLATGSVEGTIPVIDPVHLMYDGSRYVYIGSEKQNAVYLFDTQNPANDPQELGLPSPALDKTGGLAIAADGNNTYLFVTSREGMQVNQYTLDTTTSPPTVTAGAVFTDKLSDNPEFVSALGVSGAVSG